MFKRNQFESREKWNSRTVRNWGLVDYLRGISLRADWEFEQQNSQELGFYLRAERSGTAER